MTVTKQELTERADQLKAKIASGKLKGKALGRAKKNMYALRYRARQKAAPKAKRKHTKPVDPKQGFLPSFLSQLSTPRIEEMIADRAFKAIRPALESHLGMSLGEPTKRRRSA